MHASCLLASRKTNTKHTIDTLENPELLKFSPRCVFVLRNLTVSSDLQLPFYEGTFPQNNSCGTGFAKRSSCDFASCTKCVKSHIAKLPILRTNGRFARIQKACCDNPDHVVRPERFTNEFCKHFDEEQPVPLRVQAEFKRAARLRQATVNFMNRFPLNDRYKLLKDNPIATKIGLMEGAIGTHPYLAARRK